MMDLGVIRKGMAEKMMMLMDMTTHKYVSDKQSDVFWRCLDYKIRCEELGKHSLLLMQSTTT